MWKVIATPPEGEIRLFVMGDSGPPNVGYLTVPLHSDMLTGFASTT